MQPDLLSQLKDIQTPDAIGWWPLAWGWYVVIFLFCLTLFVLIKQLIASYKLKRAKKLALTAMKDVDNIDTPLAQVTAINDILKRVVLAYSERSDVAQLAGEQWASWLNSRCKKGPAIDPSLLTLSYQPNCNAEQASRYQQQVTAWISNNLPLSPKLHENGKTSNVIQEAKHV